MGASVNRYTVRVFRLGRRPPRPNEQDLEQLLSAIREDPNTYRFMYSSWAPTNYYDARSIYNINGNIHDDDMLLRHRPMKTLVKKILVMAIMKLASGAMVFGKTAAANRSLTEQFARHQVEKVYLLATDRPINKTAFTVRSALIRTGDKYVSRPLHAGGDVAETHFKFLRTENGRNFIEARPVTGRTHQIRVHAAEHGLSILGDDLYGGTPAARLWLHAAELSLKHPASRARMTFRAPINFESSAALLLRRLHISQPFIRLQASQHEAS